MNCAGGAGVRYRLAELGLPHPDIEVDISGNIPNAAYAIADQHHLGLQIWAEDLPSDPEFIQWNRSKEIISVDRMVDFEFREKRPLIGSALHHTETQFFFATTDVASRKTKYFTNEDVRGGVDPLEIIRAGTAFVGFTRPRPVRIEGKLYSDAATSTTLQDCIHVAFDAGAEFVVAIDNRTIQEQQQFRDEFASSGWKDRVALLQPDLPSTMATNNPAEIKQSFYSGFRMVSAHPLLREFFGDLTAAPRRVAA